jgi:GLPGLI family protein
MSIKYIFFFLIFSSSLFSQNSGKVEYGITIDWSSLDEMPENKIYYAGVKETQEQHLYELLFNKKAATFNKVNELDNIQTKLIN